MPVKDQKVERCERIDCEMMGITQAMATVDCPDVLWPLPGAAPHTEPGRSADCDDEDRQGQDAQERRVDKPGRGARGEVLGGGGLVHAGF